jgi:hypothetical protein
VDTAALERAHANTPPQRFVELFGRRPADVLAARALIGVDLPTGTPLQDTLAAAAETLDP